MEGDREGELDAGQKDGIETFEHGGLLAGIGAGRWRCQAVFSQELAPVAMRQDRHATFCAVPGKGLCSKDRFPVQYAGSLG
ncbi:hypothetical protein GCM10011335_07470 [Aureimonas glaciei]|uniref:Uncharacterized protein n=1 Tax=Aureimonas glaciei TaxID=1776957 RepID=A0A916XT43_9HYPH|nr:hypothetical protein GCM10011335_07470 [Aureimonas glaciei]